MCVWTDRQTQTCSSQYYPILLAASNNYDFLLRIFGIADRNRLTVARHGLVFEILTDGRTFIGHKDYSPTDHAVSSTSSTGFLLVFYSSHSMKRAVSSLSPAVREEIDSMRLGDAHDRFAITCR